MQETVDLLVDRLRGEAVARVLAAEAAGEIDVLAPVGVDDPGAIGECDDEGWRRNPARDITLSRGRRYG